MEQVEVILKSVKEHHLFAKGKGEKQQILSRLLCEVGQLMNQTGVLVAGLSTCRERVMQSAVTTLTLMQEVAKRLLPQIVQWMSTGVVARGKILHAGIAQARAIVRNKAVSLSDYWCVCRFVLIRVDRRHGRAILIDG